MSAAERMAQYVETAFALDSAGRLLEVNDGLHSIAPRAFIAATAEGSVVYARHDLPEETFNQLHETAANEPRWSDLKAGGLQIDAYRRAVAESGAPVLRLETGPFYWFPALRRDPARTTAVPTAENVTLSSGLAAWADALPHWRPVGVALEGGQAIAICASVRRSKSACVAGCETDVAFRGRGHGGEAVTRWVAAVQATERLAFYNTEWSNAASQRLAARAGAEPFGEGLHLF